MKNKFTDLQFSKALDLIANSLDELKESSKEMGILNLELEQLHKEFYAVLDEYEEQKRMEDKKQASDNEEHQ